MELQDYLSVVRKRWRVILSVVLVVCRARQRCHPRRDEDLRVAHPVLRVDDRLRRQRRPAPGQHLHPAAGEVLRPAAHARRASSRRSPPRSASRATSPTRSPPRPRPTPCSSRWRCATADPEQAKAMATAIAKEFPAAVSELESPAGNDVSPVKVTVVQPADHPRRPGQPEAAAQHPARRGARPAPRPRRGPGPRDARQDGQDDQDDVKAVTDAPILGAIAHDPDAAKRPLIVEVDPRSPRAEAFRSLRTNLQFVDAANHPRTLRRHLLPRRARASRRWRPTSPSRMAQGGSRVCLVEADLRRPKVLDYLGLEGARRPHRRAHRPGRRPRRHPALRRHQPVGARRRPDPAEPVRAAGLDRDAQHARPPGLALRLRRHRLPARRSP